MSDFFDTCQQKDEREQLKGIQQLMIKDDLYLR